MLAARSAKGLQGVAGGVVALGGGYLADGVGHGVVGNRKEAFQKLRARPAALFDHLGQPALGIFGGYGCGKARGVEPAEEEVDVGQAKRPPEAVAGGTGVSAGALGADPQEAVLDPADRAAPRGHRLDLHGDAGNAGVPDLVGGLIGEGPGIARDVRAGPAHVQVYELLEPCGPGGRPRTHHPARRAAQQAVDGPVAGPVDQPPRARGDEQVAPLAHALPD